MRSEVARKKINPGDKIQVTFTVRERQLVLEQTLAGPDVTGSLAAAKQVGGKFPVCKTRT
jgi:hypothetical protein